MCGISRVATQAASTHTPTSVVSTGPYFNCTRLNPSTFLIVEHDKWEESPFIYVKLYPSTVVIIDSGTGGAVNNPDAPTTLRNFLENEPVLDNDGWPLNPGSAKPYTVILSHGHYDHLGGLAEFSQTPCSDQIWASVLGKDIMHSPDRLNKSSLSSYVGMKTPQFQVSNWAMDGQPVIDRQGNDLDLIIYQTPGHTPDELAVWDPKERHLFVGDTAYDNGPILFPLEGNSTDYGHTLQKLQGLVSGWNREDPSRPVKMGGGHLVSSTDAGEFLSELSTFYDDIKNGKIEPLSEDKMEWAPDWLPGEEVQEYDRADKRFWFVGPKRYFDEIKKPKEG